MNHHQVVIFHQRKYYWNQGYYMTIHGRLLHRDIWESLHGTLPPNHVVHHADFNRENNDPENLKGIPDREHKALHREAMENLNKTCLTCDKDFKAKNANAKFCSSQCQGAMFRASRKDDAEYIERNRARGLARYWAHKDDINRKSRAHYALHKEQKRAYREAHKEGKRDYDRAYYLAHKDDPEFKAKKGGRG